MIVEDRNIGEIVPYDNNPRDNSEAIEKVAESIREFGWQQPIVVDKDDVIMVGHTRYEAAKLLGMTTVPVVVADNLTPEQVKAYRLADNKVAEYSSWDFKKLQSELEGIGDIDMSSFGFDDYDIDIDSLFKRVDSSDNNSDGEDDSDDNDDVLTCPACGARFDHKGNVIKAEARE